MSEKEKIIKEIMDLMDRLKNIDSKASGSLFISGDALTDQSAICMKGNPEILSAAFLSQMATNTRFNQIVMAILGTYISNNPEEKEKLISGINLLELFPINPN